MKIRVRPARASDLGGLALLAQSLATSPDWPPSAYSRVMDRGEPRRIALVAEDASREEIAGFVIALLLPPEAELETVAVAPGLQRRGIGSRLLGDLLSEMTAQGITLVHLEVRASNRPALALYHRAGFLERARRPRYYADPVEDAVIMSLDRAPLVGLRQAP